MLTQISLTPFDDRKTLRLITDGASTEGVGFVLFPGFPIEGTMEVIPPSPCEISPPLLL